MSLPYSEKLKVLREQKFYSNSKLSVINDYLNKTFKILKNDKSANNIRGIYVYGNYGIGKTLLLHTFLCIIKIILEFIFYFKNFNYFNCFF